ncbi:tryptophanyl-trna synthetase, putative [Theileria annulata]|uniref:tryptophan--tRNA ligase n=1 Tax=Theileria annulata TaxID=5874 RepID=Q4UH65_THEAN|nr:tryptophanyl-trna synthetase, putative [Theileria annulata]CAI73574.1 tryptophanyl-trna synthetase, putative [Theileria annulata]|eukprot:XP_954251.1 tryptophanyl-trna synthetase, putative [Theileria annulata]
MVEKACSFVESSFHIIKGAACTAFSIPTARSTKSVKRLANYNGIMTLSKLNNIPSDGDYNLFKKLIEDKIAENARFRVINVDRSMAESLYGESIYDDFVVPATVKTLRLVVLDEWNINANIHNVLYSTGLIREICINKFKYKPETNTLDIHFNVIPASEELLCKEEDINKVEDCPLKENVLPPGEVEYNSAQYLNIIDSSKTDVVDYNKLTFQFGCSLITNHILNRVKALVGNVHPFLRRKMFFCHRDFDQLLDNYEKGNKFFIYTGRGPSSEALHLGHLIPFIFTCWLQKSFNVPVVIMLSDDEKFVFREELELENVRNLALENAKDIIAVGFDPELTFIFRNTDYIQHLYKTTLKLQKKTTFNQLRGSFGFDYSTNVGMISYPLLEGAASFSESFPNLFNNKEDIMCLVPQGIDQDPFFRLTRSLAPKLGLKKPALIHSKFIPSLLGVNQKMSSSIEGSAIFVTDDAETIKRKIHKYAFSGGRDTAKEHMELGPNLDVDVSYQYLNFLVESDEELEEITQKYKSGQMLTNELKNKLVDILVPIVENHQRLRSQVDDEMLRKFMDPNRESFRQFFK